MKTFIFTVLVCTVLFSCKEQKADTKAEGEKLMQISREWSKSAATDSIDKIVSYWSDDAVFLSNGQPMLTGKAQIQGMVESSIKMPGFNINWEPVSVSVSESGDMAYMIEQNHITMTDSLGKPIVKHGKGVTIWKKDASGNWKNVLEIGVDDPSAP